MQYFGIEIDLTRDQIISEFAMKLLKDYYMRKDESSPQEAYARAAIAYCGGDLELAQRLYDYVSKGWFMYSSPVLSNAPKSGEKAIGLPISCFLQYIGDNLESIINSSSELRWMSVKGGGVGGHWSSVRSVSDKAPGVIPFLKTADADMQAYKQGSVRRGSYAAYLDISHPDIIEFLNMRTPTGGDSNRKCLNLHNAVNITDDFMEAIVKNSEWKLVDPHDKIVRETINARELWERILETRFRTGEPYIHYIDTSNKYLPNTISPKARINGSNLCAEVLLATSETRSAVCCLSSLNLEYYDSWKATPIIRDLIRMLDNVLEEFIKQAPQELHKAIYSAQQERSLGLGAMGFHALLQKNNVPWESALAKVMNQEIFAHIKEEAVKETMQLAIERGEYEDAKTSLSIELDDGSTLEINSSDLVETQRGIIRAFDLKEDDEVLHILD